jgi:hypothetical protein
MSFILFISYLVIQQASPAAVLHAVLVQLLRFTFAEQRTHVEARLELPVKVTW